MAGAESAITQATRLSEVGFAEFTSKLVNDVFMALLNTNLIQTASYMALVAATATTLKDYITNTKDDISLPEIVEFIQSIKGLPALVENTSLSQEQADALNAATYLPDNAGANNNNKAATTNKLTTEAIKTVQGAVAQRIAANKYDLLCTMVRMGILRLVVDSGVIETRLTFSTYGYTESSREQKLTEESRGAAGGAGAGVGAGYGFGMGTHGFDVRDMSRSLLGMAGGAGVGAGIGAGGLTYVTTTTASKSDRDVNGSSVQIFGRVEIRFKTDYTPLGS